MRMTRFLLFAFLVCAAAPAFAQSVDFDRHVLRSIDTAPTRAQLDATFDDAPARLRAAAIDTERPQYERERAITLLSLYPDDETKSFLKQLTRSGDSTVSPKAVYTLARTFGRVADDALVEFIAAQTESDVDEVREWAVRGLRWVAHPRAIEVLKSVAAGSDEELTSVARRAIRKHVGAPSSER